MEELESQNDAQVEGLSAKVKMLKEVCFFSFPSSVSHDRRGEVLIWAGRGIDYRGYRRRSQVFVYAYGKHERFF